MSIQRAMRSAILGVSMAMAGAALLSPIAAEEEKKEAGTEAKKPVGLLEILKIGEKKEPAKEEPKTKPRTTRP